MKGGSGRASHNNRSNQMNPNNPAFASSRASTVSAANNRSNQLNPNNSAFWSSRVGAVTGGGAAAFHNDPLMGQSVTLNFSNRSMTGIPVPKFAVGYALHGKVENGVVDLTPEHPLLIIFVRKTPKHDTCAGAFWDAREHYPTLQLRELSAIHNGGMPGEPPPYWCMRMTRNEEGVLELDTGCGFDSLEGVVDGLVRAPRPKAPCGLEAPRPECPDCKKPMETGTASRRNEYGRLDVPLFWQAPDRRTREERDCSSFKEPPTLPIRTYRCPGCGLLRDYAFAHADWHVWDKDEKESAEAGE